MPKKPKLISTNEGLVVKNLRKSLSRKPIVRNVSLKLERGKTVGLLGANGAGKTTTFYSIMGLINVSAGRFYINGSDKTNLPTHKIVNQGVGYVPQVENVFPSLSIEENIEIGAWSLNKNRKSSVNKILEDFPMLNERKKDKAGNLSGGQRQQVALGRALMIKPSVLMLDEPTAGVSPIVMDELFDHIIKVKKTNVAILMVEQNAKQALSISDRGYVLVTGENKYSGTGKELLNDPRVRSSFLGG